MNKIMYSIITVGILFTSSYYGSTTAPVIISGAIIATQHIDHDIKYKRKDCPVCKGKGWYISGDKIERVECGYCEPDEGAKIPNASHPECKNGKCPIPSRIR